MSWTAPSSPTGGLQPYRVEGAAPRRRSTADETYLRILRLFQNRSDAEPKQELGKMNPIGQMVDTLRKSIDEALKIGAEDKRTELLNKSFSEFSAVLQNDVATAMDMVAQETYMRGVTGKALVKIDEDDGPLQKGISHIASFASALRSAESTVMSMVNDSYSRDQLSDDAKGATAAWVEFGAGVLRMLVMELGGGMEMAAEPEMTGEAEVAAGEAEKSDAPGPKEMAKLAKRLQAAVSRFSGAPLAKAAPDADAAAGAGGDDVDQMEPVEVMGRLAAAIVMMADQMIPGTDEAQVDGAVAAADGAASVDGAPAEPSEEEIAKAEAEAAALAAAEDGGEGAAAEGEQAAVEGEQAAAEAAAAEEAEAEGAKEFTEGGDADKEEDEEVGKSTNSTALMKMIDGRVGKIVDPLRKSIAAKDAEIADLRAKLGKQPAPAKGSILAIGKGADDALAKSASIEDEAERLAKMDPKDRAEALIKAAFRGSAVRT